MNAMTSDFASTHCAGSDSSMLCATAARINAVLGEGLGALLRWYVRRLEHQVSRIDSQRH